MDRLHYTRVKQNYIQQSSLSSHTQCSGLDIVIDRYIWFNRFRTEKIPSFFFLSMLKMFFHDTCELHKKNETGSLILKLFQLFLCCFSMLIHVLSNTVCKIKTNKIKSKIHENHSLLVKRTTLAFGTW